jgi:hypothetical protein
VRAQVSLRIVPAITVAMAILVTPALAFGVYV